MKPDWYTDILTMHPIKRKVFKDREGFAIIVVIRVLIVVGLDDNSHAAIVKSQVMVGDVTNVASSPNAGLDPDSPL